MTFLQQISVLVLTYNEAPNIARTLTALKEFPEVLVLDSVSADETLTIAGGFANVRIASRTFDSHAAQWNHGLTHCGLDREWVLALDADYVVTPALLREIAALAPSNAISGFQMGFRYCVWGKELSGSLYPPVLALYRRVKARYVQDGHTQRVVVEGEVRHLNAHMLHDDRKPLAHWLAAQGRYAQLECDTVLGKPWAALNWRDRLRRMLVVTPWLVPLYCLTVGRGALDGWAGVFYAIQRSVAESILSLTMIQKMFNK